MDTHTVFQFYIYESMGYFGGIQPSHPITSYPGIAQLVARLLMNHLISGEIDQAKALAPSLKAAGYTMLVTQHLEDVKSYYIARYTGQLSMRYVLLASSKADSSLMNRYGIDNSYETTSIHNMDIAAWYNDPPDSPKPCCSFRHVVTEFSCQGLELDLPILCWRSDMTWNG